MGKPRGPRAVESEQLQVIGLDEPVEVRRHPTARRMTLRVSRTKRAVIVTLPLRCNLKQAGRFLSTNIEWVRERLTSMPEPVPFADGGSIPLRGLPHRIVFVGPKRGVPVRQVRTVGSPDGEQYGELHVAGQLEHAPRRLRDWLANEAKNDLIKRAAHHARNLNVEMGRITVRDQTSRWGSCSSNGNLSFSWRLILAPSTILDYVAAHEVAHLQEMNHGPNFWALVERTYPDLEQAKKWLQIYGLDLHRYGSDA
jgi:predicted metal-dependent hydrolase